MNEFELLTRLRDEVPLAPPSPAAQRLVMAAISSSAGTADRRGTAAARRAAGPARTRPAWPGPGRWQRHQRGLRAGLAGLIAVGACAAGAVVVAGTREARPEQEPQTIAWSGRPTGPLPDARPSLGRASSEAQLVDYATRAAATSPGPAPAADEWVFVRTEIAQSSAGGGGFLFGPPDERLVCLQWVRVDWREHAGLVSQPRGQVTRRVPGQGAGGCVAASYPSSAVQHESLTITASGGGTVGGWKSISYSYLSSLPTDPAALERVILADNLPDMPWYASPDNVAIFNAITTLLEGQTEGVWIPPALAATMYKILQQLPGVHFDTAADLAGRTGIGFYMVIGGWYKQELVIDPDTYTYMGDESVAVTDHQQVATDGTSHIKAGQVLGWEALLNSAIVQQPGQLP